VATGIFSTLAFEPSTLGFVTLGIASLSLATSVFDFFSEPNFGIARGSTDRYRLFESCMPTKLFPAVSNRTKLIIFDVGATDSIGRFTLFHHLKCFLRHDLVRRRYFLEPLRAPDLKPIQQPDQHRFFRDASRFRHLVGQTNSSDRIQGHLDRLAADEPFQ